MHGVIGNKLIDLEWVKRIEDTLPYMDNAIRESRSFIEQKDEVVSIEKVKRVNTQSIRHLAQNTNFIAKVEDNGDVLPNKILNIYYESNVAIYENRFLYTLLLKLSDFIEKRYRALNDKDEKIEINYKINKQVRRKGKLSKMLVDFDYNTSATTKKPTVKGDVDSLSGFARVERIRSIVQDFFLASLIKELTGVERVRPPIIHTNLMSKNVNFRNCLELWEYIDRYEGAGYVYENKEFSGDMPANINNNLQDIFVFSNFITEITFNTEYQKELKKSHSNFVKEQRKVERELLQLQNKEAKEKTQQAINNRLEKARKSHKKQTDKLKQRIEMQNKRNKARIEKETEKYNRVTGNLRQRNQNYRDKNLQIQNELRVLKQEVRELKKQSKQLKKENKLIKDKNKT